MKKRPASAYILYFILIFIFIPAISYANSPSPESDTNGQYLPFDNIYMTSGYGTYDIRTHYGTDETPWLYLQLPDLYEGGLWSVNTLWRNVFQPDNYFIVENGPDSLVEIWLSSDDWNSVTTRSNWEIRADYSFDDGTAGTGYAYFKFKPAVVPEPISSMLFLSGGATLLTRRLWKKK